MAAIAALLDVTAECSGAAGSRSRSWLAIAGQTATHYADHGKPGLGGRGGTHPPLPAAPRVPRIPPQVGIRSGTVGEMMARDSSGLVVAQTLLVAIIRISSRGAGILVIAKQQLDGAEICTGLQQVNGQRSDAGSAALLICRCRTARRISRQVRSMVDGVIGWPGRSPRKQPLLWDGCASNSP